MTIAPTLTLRPATTADSSLLWEWRNDPPTRVHFINADAVSWEEHCAWLQRKLESPDCRMWILERDGGAVGQIRYDRIGRSAEISFLVIPGLRGQGLGTRLLELSPPLACRELRVSSVVAIVKAENEASSRAFRQAGFSLDGLVEIGGQQYYRFERSCPG